MMIAGKWLFLGLLVAGCTEQSGSVQGVEYSTADTLEFAGSTTMSISANGDATLALGTTPPRSMTLDGAALSDLDQQITAADFPTLKPEYTCPEGESCPATVSPHISEGHFVVTVRLGGRSYSTMGDLRILGGYTDDTPQALIDVVRTLDDLLQSSSWH